MINVDDYSSTIVIINDPAPSTVVSALHLEGLVSTFSSTESALVYVYLGSITATSWRVGSTEVALPCKRVSVTGASELL